MNIAEQKNLETLERLRTRLLEEKRWPQKYMFKFIVPNESGKVNAVVLLLPENGETSFRPSKDIHYVGITNVVMMNSADEVIDVVKRVTSIEGVISL